VSNVLVVRDKVQRFSKEMFGVVNLDDDGGLIIPYESTRIFIDVYERILENKEFQIKNKLSTTVVNVWSPVLRNLKPSPSMFEWVATEGQANIYGHFKLLTNDEGQWILIFEVTIPGDTLDPGELKEALISVALTADDEDDILKARFGGLRGEDE
jgi:hypothetical protein